MIKYLNISIGMLIFVSQNLCAWQTNRGTTLFLADGKIAHLVPSSVVRKTMDFTLGSTNDVATPSSTTVADQHRYVVQVGTFAIKENAFRMEHRLRDESYVVKVWQYNSKGNKLYYVVTVGDYRSASEAHERLISINLAYNVEGLVLEQRHTKE